MGGAVPKYRQPPRCSITPLRRHLRQWRLSVRRLLPTELGMAIAIASVAATSMILSIRQVGGLQPLELAVYDQFTRLKPALGDDPRLLIVEVTEADFRTYKRLPLADRVIAQTLQQLQRDQPRAIGLDIFRDIPNEPGSQELAEQLSQPNVIAVTYVGNAQRESIPAPAHLPDSQIGFNDLITDPDGVVRRSLLYLGNGDIPLSSFAVQLATVYLSAEKVPTSITAAGELQLGDTVFPKLQPSSGGYQTIDAQGYQILLNYRSATSSIRHVTLQQVLENRVDPAWVKDKVVLIGMTAPSAKDAFYTPYSRAISGNRQTPGVLIHAQMTSQILAAVLDHQPLIWSWSDPIEAVWIASWALLSSIVSWQVRRVRWLGLAAGLSYGLLAGVGFQLFLQAGWVPLVAPALAMGLAGGSLVIYRGLHSKFFDGLTRLPNRTLFLRRLQRDIHFQHRFGFRGSPKRPTLFAVLFLDLDRFKVVNDSVGHHIGDQLLIASSHRLRACLRRTDTLARVGGDEFAILLRDIHHLDEATRVADRLQQEMADPFTIKHQQIFTSISIGIALSQPEHQYKPEDLLRDAHTAMYRAKSLGKARHEVFASGMRVQVVRQLQLETDLRRALEQQEFELHYQPIVALDTGATAGFEALLRWQHPEYGFISPEEFIPVAEETGVIVPLGQWILQTACQQLKQWQTQFAIEPALMVSVNLSGQQFTQADLVEFIEQTLTETQLDGHSLKLEITESVAMKDVEAAIALLLRLKALNLQLSIDDFGTGYSSLSYLHRFPVDMLKVDRSFVSRMDDASDDAEIVATIVGLAQSLKLHVVAEGVETAAQLTKLQALRCEYGQGFFFSKPLSAQQATDLLAAHIHWLKPQ